VDGEVAYHTCTLSVLSNHWRYVALVVVLASSVVGVVVVGVCNRSQMRTSKCTCLIFGVSIGLDPVKKCTKGIFDRSKFKVTRDISPTISGWLLVFNFNGACAVLVATRQRYIRRGIWPVLAAQRWSCAGRWTSVVGSSVWRPVGPWAWSRPGSDDKKPRRDCPPHHGHHTPRHFHLYTTARYDTCTTMTHVETEVKFSMKVIIKFDEIFEIFKAHFH